MSVALAGDHAVRRRRRLRDPFRAGGRRARERRRGARNGGLRIPARGDRAALPATGERLAAVVGAAGPGRLPRRAAHRGSEAVRAAGVDPAAVVGIATDFTASTPMPVRRDGTPLCELPEYRERPHAYPKLWKHHAAQAQAERVNRARRRSAASRGWPLRRADLLRMGVRQGAAGARGGSGALRRDGPLDRGRRLDRLAALRRRDAQRLHRGLQGHPPGRRLPSARLPRRARRALRGLRGRQARAPALAARRSRGRPDRARPPSGPGSARGSRSRSATSTRT